MKVLSFYFERDNIHQNDYSRTVRLYENWLYKLIPAVIQTLKNEREIDSYVKFNMLLAGNDRLLKLSYSCYSRIWFFGISWTTRNKCVIPPKTVFESGPQTFHRVVPERYEWHEKSRTMRCINSSAGLYIYSPKYFYP